MIPMGQHCPSCQQDTVTNTDCKGKRHAYCSNCDWGTGECCNT